MKSQHVNALLSSATELHNDDNDDDDDDDDDNDNVMNNEIDKRTPYPRYQHLLKITAC